MSGGASPRPRIGLVSAWCSRLGGGVFEAVVAHCAMVREIGFEPVVIALADEYSAADRARFGETEVIAVPVVGPPMVGYAPAMVRALTDARLDLLHLHGIWMYPSAAASRWRALTGKPYVISPHGMMDPWIVGRGKAKKAIARLAYERASWRRASAFHALTEDEAGDILAATGRGGAVVIPNAVEPAAGRADRRPVLAYVGRIHPKKNLDGLIDGWIAARESLSPHGARLRIAGWGDDDHVAALRGKLAEAGGDDIEFLGPVYGAEKQDLLGTAAFLALPSHSEGLPVAILEAWALGTPTIMTRHCHLPEGFVRGAAIECGTDAKSIAAALARGFGLAEETRREMGLAASALIEQEFSPAVVSRRWHEAYAALMQESGR